MPSTFTIDFLDRTRAHIAYKAVSPRSSDLWTETLSHLAFCAVRTIANLEREDQIEVARQWDTWLKSGFAEFPVQEERSPGAMIPCGRFVSAYDGDAGSYTRSTYGFGLNARGLDYYGPLATAAMLHHISKHWDHPEDLLRPVRTLCEYVLLNPVDEAGHVELATGYVSAALEIFRRRATGSFRVKAPPPEKAARDRNIKGSRRQGSASLWAGWTGPAVVGLTLTLGLGLIWYLNAPSPPISVPAGPIQTANPTPAPTRPSLEKPVMQAQVAHEAVKEREAVLTLEIKKRAEAERAQRKEEERRLEELRTRLEAEREQARLAELRRQEAEARQAEASRQRAEEARKAEEQRLAEAKRQQEEKERQRVAEAKRQEEARLQRPIPPPALERVFVGRDGAPMVLIPAGEFQMGSETTGEGPPRRVFLEAFYIDQYEVTNTQYLRFVQATRHRLPLHDIDPRYDVWEGTTVSSGVAARPVVNVDWHDAAAYCKWAGKRLPTEAEWEKAARGTDGRAYPWGNEPPSPSRLNFARQWEGPATLQPVGSFESGGSPYGAQDMAGNVWEWVSDWYDAGYYRTAQERNPRGPATGSAKVLRGGAWTSHADSVRVTYRHADDPEMRNSNVGFRCAQNAS